MSKSSKQDLKKGNNIMNNEPRLDIVVKDNEIALSVDKFCDMRTNDEFVDYRIDEDDGFKVIGTDKNGKIYVSESPLMGTIPDNIMIYYDLVIRIKPDEIPVSIGDFARMRENNQFISCEIDKDDFAKIIGVDKDGKTYVSERPDEEFNDKEFAEYYARHGITQKTIMKTFGPKSITNGDHFMKGTSVY